MYKYLIPYQKYDYGIHELPSGYVPERPVINYGEVGAIILRSTEGAVRGRQYGPRPSTQPMRDLKCFLVLLSD